LVGDARADSLSSIATRLGMTEGAVKVAAHRLRLAFRDAIRAEVTSTLVDQHDAEDEIRALFAALST
jgi:RNA polymerase sigma-70 factor (ECF subfamily)